MEPTAQKLTELWQKVDAFFARAHAAHGASITCHAGCDACCHRRFSITGVEADALQRHLDTLGAVEREALRARARSGDPSRCAALRDDGRCGVYAARPIICRTHGLALRFQDDRRRLPMLDACPKNYVDVDLASLDPATVLDQTTLSTLLAALDALHADARRRPRGARVELDALLGGRQPEEG
jgi:Fe-S-cluster containining protein